MDALVRWLGEQFDEDERIARRVESSWRQIGETGVIVASDGNRAEECANGNWTGVAERIVQHDPARVLREIDAKRQALALHAPEWTTVEWSHDQNGKGEAQVCRSCGNRDIDSWVNWHPAVGEAGVLPEGVKPPYIVAPCATLRLLALPYADRPGYREEWRP